jgi:methionyl-tRNA formyltransferase
LKVCFIGTVEFSKSVLLQLIDMGVDLCGVVSNTSNKVNSDFAELKPICKLNDIPFHDTNNINSEESIDWIKKGHPAIIFCFGWSQLIKKQLLELAPMGVVGFHPSLLPKNRGRHPIIWALSLGLEKTGSTFFFMDEGADSGDILSQKEVSIDYEDDAESLYQKITITALEQIKEFVPSLQEHQFKRIKQNHAEANVWRKRGMADGKIDFHMSSRAIYNQIRALTKPYVGAHIEQDGHNIQVWRAKEHECDWINIEPGKVLKVIDNKILVKSYDGAILIEQHEFKILPKEGSYL